MGTLVCLWVGFFIYAFSSSAIDVRFGVEGTATQM